MKRTLIALSFLALPATAMADGKATYDAMCASCHGAAGAGDGVAAAALTPKPANFTDAEVWTRIDETGFEGVKGDDYIAKVLKEGGASVGRSAMMAPLGAGMTDDQIKEVAAYLRTLKK